MNLSELIHSRFVSCEGLTALLTKFGKAPAVFNTEPPLEESRGWGQKSHYPRIVFNYDMQANQERHSAGTLMAVVLCQNDGEIQPEEIEPEVKKSLLDVIFTPEGGTPYCFSWARTDSFTVEDKSTGHKGAGQTIGCEVRFDILEYPSQITTDPDPIMAMNRYVKKLYPKALIIGYDAMAETETATKERPAIFCRLIQTDRARDETLGGLVAWMDSRLSIHVICPDGGVRMKMATDVANALSLDAEVEMLDRSPMQIRRLQANYQADYLKEGQITATVHYGILAYSSLKEPMKTPSVGF